jgi:hypothetical protein
MCASSFPFCSMFSNSCQTSSDRVAKVFILSLVVESGSQAARTAQIELNSDVIVQRKIEV